MLVNSFLPIVTLSLGSYTVKLPNHIENVSMQYTGIFLKSVKNTVFILKSELSEVIAIPLTDDIKKLPFYDLAKNSCSESIPLDILKSLNDLFSNVSREIQGISPIDLYLSGFITDNVLIKSFNVTINKLINHSN